MLFYRDDLNRRVGLLCSYDAGTDPATLEADGRLNWYSEAEVAAYSVLADKVSADCKREMIGRGSRDAFEALWKIYNRRSAQ